jgi:putative ABC transport system ATP-binding protein
LRAEALRRSNDDDNWSHELEAVDLKKTYWSGDEATHALDGVSFTVEKGDWVSIIGPSGSGKSTLLNMLGALDRPTSGRVFIEGVDVNGLSNTELAVLRNRKLGFVFQDFHLLSRMTVVENVELSLMIAGVSAKERRKRALRELESLSLSPMAERKANILSGGEKQRVAVARALINDPSIMLADEPTGNLDTRNTEIMMEILRRLNEDLGKTLVVITHNPEVASKGKRTISMRDGKIEHMGEN